jgi:cysteine desulfurase
MVEIISKIMVFGKSKRIYLDYASVTPLRKAIWEKMKEVSLALGNPSSIHFEGRKNREVIEKSREKVAKILHVKKEEIYFTSGGTESVNLALRGLLLASKEKISKAHFIVSAMEHPAVLELMKEFEKEGIEISWVYPNKFGLTEVQSIIREIRENTVGISIMHVNNEIGSINPIREIGIAINKFKKQRKEVEHQYPFFHVDASQSAMYEKVSADYLQADLITIDGSKIYGPRGIAILLSKNSVPLNPIILGGGQERGLRPGTENTSAILGFSEALEFVDKNREENNSYLEGIKKYAIQRISELKNIKWNSPLSKSTPHILNFCMPNTQSEFLVIALDERGVSCSAMTACKSSGDDLSSYVIKSFNPECASSSLRISFGLKTKKRDIDYFIKQLKEVCESQNIEL